MVKIMVDVKSRGGIRHTMTRPSITVRMNLHSIRPTTAESGHEIGLEGLEPGTHFSRFGQSPKGECRGKPFGVMLEPSWKPSSQPTERPF